MEKSTSTTKKSKKRNKKRKRNILEAASASASAYTDAYTRAVIDKIHLHIASIERKVQEIKQLLVAYESERDS